MRVLRHSSLLLLGGWLSACATISTPYEPPTPVETEQGDSFITPVSLSPLEDEPAHDWWRGLGDPALEALIEQAFEANLNSKIADANIRAARASVTLQGIARRPTGSLNAQIDYGQPALAGGPVQVDVDPQTVISAGGSALWEPDLFGRLAQLDQAVLADLETQLWTRRDVQAVLAADVARAWLDVRAAEDALALTQDNLDIQQDTLDLTQLRFDEGFATQLDTSLASSQLRTTSALVPPLRANRIAALNRLATLTSLSVSDVEAELQTSGQSGLPQDLPATLPLDDIEGLLRRRADIRSAEQAYAAAFARTNVAYTDYFPRLTLNGQASLVGTSLGNLTGPNSFGFGIGPQLIWEGIDRPAVTARLAIAQADTDRALATYQLAILNALEETQSQFAAFSNQSETLSILALAEADVREAVELSRIRYQEGEDDFLAVLDTEARLLEISNAALNARTATFASIISVYQALGAGWVTK